MNQRQQFDVRYPFGNPDRIISDDAESYHSITNDEKKLRYFQEAEAKESSKISQFNLKKKNPLPPTYPYEQVKKLKQSLKIQRIPQQNNDNMSVNSIDSFHTANEFQSICYEQGDFQKVNEEIQAQKREEIRQSTIKSSQNQQNKQIIDINTQNQRGNAGNLLMKKSSAFDDEQVDELENLQNSKQQFEGFEQGDVHQLNSSQPQKDQSDEVRLQDDKIQQQKQGQISQIEHIERALNQSELIDNQILQLTKQLQKIQSSQQQLQQKDKLSQQCIKNQQVLSQRYIAVQNKLRQLQQTQQNFGSQITHMHSFIKMTKQNNLYLVKEVEFFKQKAKKIQQKEKSLEQKEQKLRQKQLNTSKNYSLSFSSAEQKLKPKTYNIRPKAPNNQSLQSRKYKELTFEYCSRSQNKANEDTWNQLEVDTQNSPPEYKLTYSFQHENTVLVVRLVELISNQTSKLSNSNKKPYSQASSTIKKNYQYLIDFAHNKYDCQQQKLKSLTKQLIVNIQQSQYFCKEFTKKIEIFLLISQDQTYVDLVKLVPLPNPLALYLQKRFNSLGHSSNKEKNIIENQKDSKLRSKNDLNQNQIAPDSQQTELKQNTFRCLSNLSRFMKTYIIKVQRMADIESIQKLMNLQWINSSSSSEPKYFSIKAQTNSTQKGSLQKSSQLFYVKIEDCILENGGEHQKLDQKYRYSLVFKVASTLDNDLLVDLIEFLTFLTVY